MGVNTKRQLLVLTAALTVGALWVPQTALSQEEENQLEARQHYSAGKELYDSGKYEEALEEFQLAYEAKPHPVVLKSVAECLVQLGDIPNAIARYEQYLDESPKRDRKAKKRVKELKALLGTVEVTTTPDGAKVFINGRPTDLTTPANVSLGPGEYDITLSLEAYEPLVKHINLQKAQQVFLDVNFVAEGTAIAKMETDDLAPAPTFDEPVEEPPGEEGPTQPAVSTTYQLDSDSGGGPSLAFWISAAVTGVGLVSGTVFGTMALSEESDFQDEPTMDKKEAGERDALIADISFGVAAAAAVTGLVVLVFDSGDDSAPGTAAAPTNRFNVTPVAGQEVIGINTSVTF